MIFTISLKCTRDCYFCFNKNQDNYEHDRSHVRDAARELECAHAAGAQFDCLALTGGEPLLHKPQTLAFFQCAKRLYPHAHTRLYTCGDLLDAECLAQLAQAGLREIRFSVKPTTQVARKAFSPAWRKRFLRYPTWWWRCR